MWTKCVDGPHKTTTNSYPQNNSHLKHMLIQTLIHRLVHTNFLGTALAHEAHG